MFSVCRAVLSVHCSLVVTCWERANLLALMCDVFLCFVTFLCSVLGQVWYLIVSIRDFCLLPYFDIKRYSLSILYMRGSRTFCQMGPALTRFFSLMRGRMSQIPLLAGHQRPASETPFKWCFAVGRWLPNIKSWFGSFVILRGCGPVMLRCPISL